jgi:tetratricopeptide (TPR) repeat protein
MTMVLPGLVGRWALSAWLVLLAATAPARAAEDPEQLIKQGVALRKEGENIKAQGYFQRAYQLARTPRSAAQLGLVEQALGQWGLAEGHLVEALSASTDLWIKTTEATLTESLKVVRSHLGRVSVTGSPAGAHVRVAGVDRGVLPLTDPIYVEPGALVIEVESAGHQSARRSLTAEAGKEETVEANLPPLTIHVDVPTGPAPPAVGPDRPGGPWRRRAAWIGGGVAAAALVGGTVALLASNDSYDKFNNQRLAGSNQVQCSSGSPDKGGATCQSLLSAGDRDKTLAVVAFVGAGALAAVSTVLFLMSAHDNEAPAGAALSCAPVWSDGAGGSCWLRF